MVLLGETKDELGGSEYLKVIHGKIAGPPPSVDWDAEKGLIKCLIRAAASGLLSSAHDLSEGGLAVAVAESSIQGGTGAGVKLAGGLPLHVLLFSESQSRALVSVQPAKLEALEKIAGELGIPLEVIGETGGDSLEVEGAFSIPLEKLEDIYTNSLEKMITGAHH
ncbi:MAG: AIR synthase-related protein [Actinobacteria bacterium]|nr:AIR synthase-related protein [Actinomycetota bacterium]